MNSYNSYHTNLILLYRLNALLLDLNTLIPKSTKSNWKKKDLHKIIGCNAISDDELDLLKALMKSRKLLSAAKALYYLFETITHLLRSAENIAKILKANKATVLQTIEKVRPVLGIQRVLKSMGLTSAKMYYWLEKKRCENLVLNLCQVRHPNQLLSGEVAKI